MLYRRASEFTHHIIMPYFIMKSLDGWSVWLCMGKQDIHTKILVETPTQRTVNNVVGIYRL
jgi:hypothetical protein